jgi:CubicO group peptidase (beta-lactamase class C family)
MKKTKLFLLVLILSAQIIGLRSQEKESSDNPLLYVSFNDSIYNQSGYRYPIKINNVNLKGDKNKAGYFNGMDGYIEIRDVQQLDTVKYLSISTWIKPFNKNSWDSWISKANNNYSNSQWRVGFGTKPDSQIMLTAYNKDWVDYTANCIIETNNWYHVVYLIDAFQKQVVVYVNGIKINTISIGDFKVSKGPILVGFQQDDNIYFYGLLDEIKIYNRLLNEREVMILYSDFKAANKSDFTEKTKPYSYQSPQNNNDGIACSSIDKIYCDTSILFPLINRLEARKYGAIYSLLIAKDNKLIFEKYFGDTKPDTKQHLYSATKSFASVLVGKAIELGYIKSDTDYISDYLPDVKKLNLSNGTEKLRINHLLTMSSGLDGSKTIYSDSATKTNHAVFFLKNQEKVEPGRNFRYQDSDPHLLAHLMYNATGKTFNEFADEYLLKPMQINNYEWYMSYCGINDADVGLCVTPRDFLKLGLLALNDGKWNGNQVINQQWINKSVHQQIVTGVRQSDGYGYYWWMHKYKVHNTEISCYSARGAYGQYLIVLPSVNMVISFTGNLYDYKTVINRINREYILPAFIKE